MIYRSPYPDVSVPNVSLTELVLGSAYERGEHAALVDGSTGSVITYRALADAVEWTAGGLHRRGFRKGEIAVICSPNRPEFAIAFHAVARLGGTATTMNPALAPAEMARQLDDSQASVAFTVPEIASRLHDAAAEPFREMFCFGEESFDAMAADGVLAPEVEIAPAEDVVALPYSSGTTGVAKGVMLTHRNLVANLLQMHPVDATSDRDTLIAFLPFFHIYGLVIILNLGLLRGATILTLPRFEMTATLKAIERWRVTRLPLVPPLVRRFARDPEVPAHDLSSVRMVISGAAPLSPEVAAELTARLGCPLRQGYGMTELSPGSHMQPEEPALMRAGSVGVLHPSTICRLVDPLTGEDAAPGGPGEIWVRGPQVMKGYLNQPQATAEIITPDGWLRTGDIGTADTDGNFYIVDRLKELIKYKGFQVPPAELEALLLAHPAVADAAVIAVPDEDAGEIPKAVVVPKPTANVSEQELLAYVAERVAPYKRVRAVEFTTEIPRSPSGKILRRVLIERELG